MLGAAAISLNESYRPPQKREAKRGAANGRTVWIASLTQDGIGGEDYQSSIQAAIKQMELALPLSPDIYCLPEVFHVANLKGGRPPVSETAEDGTGKLIAPFQTFAKTHSCYILCPIYTTEQGKYYNSAVVIDRQGDVVGEYRKMRLTVNEIKRGLIPGPSDPPVFKTDFGSIGIQICYDIEWQDGWTKLAEKGAEIVFWPSAFAGGKKVNTKAWTNQYYVVSSTRKDTTKICDITGEELATSGNWNRWGVCAPVNLEKAFLHSYPYSYKFPEIQQKYGQKVKCYSLHEEEISVIECVSPDLKVSEILKEFDLITYKESLRRAEEENRQG